MAPTKRKTETKPSSEIVQTTRVTRSSSTRPKATPVVEAPVPKAKKAKPTPKEVEEPVGVVEPVPKGKQVKAKPTPKLKPEEEPAVVVEPVPKGKKAKAKATPKVKPDEVVTSAENGSVSNKTVVVEHCKQCNQFKIRGVKVKTELEKAVAGISVVINPEKPRRGCFEIREEGGKTFISLLDMKRPFAPMKALDMDAVISDIIKQVK